MINVRRFGRETSLFLIAAFPLLADWIYRVVVHRRPFWVYYYDGEVGYCYRGLHFNSVYAPREIEHPGVPLQLISAAIAPFSAHSLLQVDAFLTVGYYVVLALSLLGLVLLRRTLFKESGALMWCVGGWVAFLVPTTLTFSVIWTTDILFMAVAALVLAALWRYDGTERSIEILGAAIAFAISEKLVFVAWLGGAAVMILNEHRTWSDRVKRTIRLVVATVGALICFLAPLGRRVLSLPRWYWLLLTGHTASLGSEPQSLIKLGRDFATAFEPAIGWLLFSLVVIGLLLAAKPSGRDRTRLTFLLAAMAFSLILGIRQPYPNFHYFSPMAFASIGLIALLRSHSTPRTRAIVAIAAIPLMLMSLYRDIHEHDTSIAEETAFRARVESAVRRIAPHGIVIYSWHLPEPSLALKAVTTDPDELRLISTIYPTEGHWVPWRDRVFLPDGAKRWDIAVIPDVFVGQFPDPIGKTLQEFPEGYRIVSRRTPLESRDR